jgi:hypothetical protein
MTETEQTIGALRENVAEKINKQLFKVSYKKVSKEKKVEIENNSELSKLDLTIPLNSLVIEAEDYALNNQRYNYLPDLFERKKDKQPSIQLVGKLIKREEEAKGKGAISDGAGIDLKLMH